MAWPPQTKLGKRLEEAYKKGYSEEAITKILRDGFQKGEHVPDRRTVDLEECRNYREKKAKESGSYWPNM